ncbi:NAD-dependent epimerase/dehydratase family protein [Marinobacter sp. AL4B]|uniref:NAD-dependent epimerase/dehydratase family protein n=1 Tax=Marinobacter sp. AL4B TaxID=2871173 RepID=UPI001CAA760B|nr:NAD-dependent epimerase/dehydratase family protein [Marinobacter sp. AL4B]MBZ0335755.1 sugar nucleotide-binding protein [Marinobacter sp. AL4B]
MAMTNHKQLSRILVAGCGKLGGDMALALADHNAQVFGLRRSPEKVPAGITGIGADLTKPETLEGKLPDDLDIIIYCLTPSSYDEQGYQDAYVTGLSNLLNAIGDRPLTRLFFVSSTSVYAQNDDGWVDESSPTEPSRFTGKHILQGEQTALDSIHPATVVRFSGIYGPTRQRFLEEVLEGRMNPQPPAPYSNRIHEQDAVRAVTYMSELALAGTDLEDVYIVTDCEPVRLDEVVAWVQQQTPCKAPVKSARKGGRAGSKRCSNQRLLASGFGFRYPDFRTGYREMINSLS